MDNVECERRYKWLALNTQTFHCILFISIDYLTNTSNLMKKIFILLASTIAICLVKQNLVS